MTSRSFVQAASFAAAIALLWITCPPPALAQSAGQKVLGYYPDWVRGSYTSSMIPYAHLTHVAHSFLIPNADGSVSGTSGFAYPALVTSAHTAGVKVIAVLGGWDQSAGFSPMAADTAARRRFIGTLVSFCVGNNYDGIDLDWEYPANATDRSNLTTLVHEMRAAFTATGRALSISLALPTTGWSGQWFDVAAMKDDVDWFGIMTYDYYGNWTSKAGPNSALYGSFATNSEGWIDYTWSYYTATRGVPTGKLLIGIPFYGQVFKAATMYGASTGASQATYSTVAGYFAAGWTRYWDGVGMVPYLINAGATQTVSYDDTLSVRLKCEYARSKATGGVMIWAIGQDVVGGTQPLLQAVGTTMKPATSVPANSGPAVPTGIRLEQNYPNPFNPNADIRYQIAEFGMVRLAVYDIMGREVAILVNEAKAPGAYQVRFDAAGLASGVYMYRLSAGSTTIARTMVLIR
jgi:chitinase